MHSLRRTELEAPSAAARLAELGFAFPLLVRSPGFQTGKHCTRVEHPADLRAAIATLPGDELLVIAFVDLRDAHGDIRKYRVMMVDGELYPLHVAISHHWKVHYFSADMAERSEHRAEDAAFLSDMRAVLGANAMAALERVRDSLALDYGGIDFGLDAAGM